MWEQRELLDKTIDLEFIKANFYMSRKIQQTEILESLIISLIESQIFYNPSDPNYLSKLKNVFEYSKELQNIEYIITHQDCNELDDLANSRNFRKNIKDVSDRNFNKMQTQANRLLSFANFFNVNIIKITYRALTDWRVSSYGSGKLSLYLYYKNDDYFIIYPYYFTAGSLKEKIYTEFNLVQLKSKYECICAQTQRSFSICNCSESMAKLIKPNDNSLSILSSPTQQIEYQLNPEIDNYSFENIEAYNWVDKQKTHFCPKSVPSLIKIPIEYIAGQFSSSKQMLENYYNSFF